MSFTKVAPLAALVGLGLLTAACGNNPTDRALTGGAIGAGTGAVVGSTVGAQSPARWSAARPAQWSARRRRRSSRATIATRPATRGGNSMSCSAPGLLSAGSSIRGLSGEDQGVLYAPAHPVS